MSKIGHEEGEICGRDGCEGRIEFTKPENCSCHISAPCSACTSTYLHCPDCGWEAQEQPFNDYIATVNMKSYAYEAWRPRPLDPTKIDWHSKSHSNASMIKEGVCPPNTTRAQVEELVRGTFGGHFEYFGGGRFKYIAYTD
ncbi:hypothetical protein ABWH74_002608 [Burkholderia vietnamiensis]|nr:hypothetical protein [Burkholderia vietnamiensis]HEP6287966.1 hypothetical protein [Burkholderia vietnamiensis]HEP6312807.1 hypothetical protein [Burkholderia vietnamiensis]